MLSEDRPLESEGHPPELHTEYFDTTTINGASVLEPVRLTRATTAELLRVLRYPKFRLSPDEREDLLANYLPWCETVTLQGPIEIPGKYCLGK